MGMLSVTCAVYLYPLIASAGRDLVKGRLAGCSCLPCVGALASLAGSAVVCCLHFPERYVECPSSVSSHAIMHVLVLVEYIWEWRFLTCQAPSFSKRLETH